jgi:RND family efflux transporter MFP subunit
MQMIFNRILLITGISCSITLLTGCTNDTPSETGGSRGRDVIVVVEAVRFSNEQTRIEAVGTSRAIQSVTLTPDASGEVVAVNFDPGQRVQRGDVLIELDSRNETLAVELAQIRLEDAQKLYDRYQRTGTTGAILPTTMDAARTALEAARIELNQARIALDDRMIKAPFTGYVGITDIDPGDRVDPGIVITTIDDRDALLVSFEVPEIMVGSLKAGDRVAISTWNDQGTAAHGDVVDIGSRIDPVTRTFTARARVDNPDDRLRPGMSFRVSLDVQGGIYPLVPEVAVQWGTEGSYVWSVAGGKAHRVFVTIIQRQQGMVLVNADLVEGQRVVVEGVQRMYEGITVDRMVHSEGDYGEMDRSVKVET